MTNKDVQVFTHLELYKKAEEILLKENVLDKEKKLNKDQLINNEKGFMNVWWWFYRLKFHQIVKSKEVYNYQWLICQENSRSIETFKKRQELINSKK